MKKLLTLTLSLLMAFSLCLAVSADGDEYFDINGQKYSTLSAALAAVTDGTETRIKLLGGYTESSAIEIPSGKNIVLDLNNFTLNIQSIIVKGKLTVVDNSNDNGKLILTSNTDTSVHPTLDAHIKAIDGGTFIFNSGSMGNACTTGALTIGAYDGSKVIINGGAFEISESIGAVGTGTVEVNGGYLYVGNGTFRIGDVATNSSIKVKGGTFFDNVSNYLADGYKISSTTQGNYTFYKVVKNDANEEATSTTNTTSTSTKSYDAKDKNKDGVISCEEEMGNANWVWSESKQACVYKVTNTSVK